MSPESACGSKEVDLPFPVSPSGGKPGRAGSPHAAKSAAPPTRGAAAPLCIPHPDAEFPREREFRLAETVTAR
jgi:hypothetical protein